ncbi:MAG TPA: hypothetical protein ENK84_08850 [Desulfobulbus sp.]|nr:hypothetical protein [Desulfobulbus sp.]
MRRLDFLLAALSFHADGPAILVLDSCELLAGREEEQQLVSLLLQRLPGSVSIIVSSRSSLSFAPLTTRRLEGGLLELRDRDLVFDQAEADSFLRCNLPDKPAWLDRIGRPQQTMTSPDSGLGGPCPEGCSDERGKEDDRCRYLYEEVGGWPVAYAFYCLGKGGNSSGSVGAVRAELFSYIEREVWVGLNDKSKRFLCSAALLEPLDRELAAELLPDFFRFGAELVDAFPFFFETVDSDPGSRGWQFSRLYGQFFREKAGEVLGAQSTARLHRSAVAFFTRHGRIERSLAHLRALSDWSEIVRLLLSQKHYWLDRADYEGLLSWVVQLPTDIVAKSLQLGFLVGRIYLYTGNIAQAYHHLQTVFSRAGSGTGLWMETGCRLAEALLLRGEVEEAVELTQKLVAGSRRFSRHRVEARMFMAIGLHLLCRFEECRRIWRRIETIATSRFLPLDRSSRSYLLAPKAVFFNLEQGEFSESERILDEAIQVFRENDPRKRLSWTLLFKGVLKLELHRYEEALAWFREAAQVSDIANRSVHAAATAFLSYMSASTGRPEEARLWLAQAEKEAEKDLTLWAPILCLLSRALLTVEEEHIIRDLRRAWNLARQRRMLLPLALCAYTAFAVRARMPRQGPAFHYCLRAAEISSRWRVAHREAQLMLYLYRMGRENGDAQTGQYFDRGMALIAEKKFGFLLTDDILIDGMEYGIKAVVEKRSADQDYFLELCGYWGGRGCQALEEVFTDAPLALKGKIADFWIRNGYRAAAPYFERVIRTGRQKKTIARFQQYFRRLQSLPPDPLHIRMLGAFVIVRGSDVVCETSWKRRSAKKMFKILGLYPDTWFTGEQLTDMIWPNCTPDKARANLWAAISAIKSAIEPELPAREHSSYLRHGDGAYKLHLPSGSTLDTVTFQEKVDQGLHYWKGKDFARSLLCLEEAVALYRDDLLPEDVYESWSDEPRDRLRLLFLGALKTMVDIHFTRQDIDRCIPLLEKILACDPIDEESHYTLMQCHSFQGRDVEVIRAYRNCCQALTRELDVTPAGKIQELYGEIIAHRQEAGNRKSG